METSPARQAREVWLPNLPCVRPAGGPLSSPAHTPTLPHTHSSGLKPDVWMLPPTQGGALAGLATGDRGMSRCPMWTCFAGLWLRPPEIALRRPHRVPWRDRRPTHFSGCGGVAAGGDRKARAPADLALSLRGRSGARPVAGLPGAARGGQSPSVPGSRSRGENTFTQLGRRGTTFGAQLGLEAVCLSR